MKRVAMLTTALVDKGVVKEVVVRMAFEHISYEQAIERLTYVPKYLSKEEEKENEKKVLRAIRLPDELECRRKLIELAKPDKAISNFSPYPVSFSKKAYFLMRNFLPYIHYLVGIFPTQKTLSKLYQPGDEVCYANIKNVEPFYFTAPEPDDKSDLWGVEDDDL